MNSDFEIANVDSIYSRFPKHLLFRFSYNKIDLVTKFSTNPYPPKHLPALTYTFQSLKTFLIKCLRQTDIRFLKAFPDLVFNLQKQIYYLTKFHMISLRMVWAFTAGICLKDAFLMTR